MKHLSPDRDTLVSLHLLTLSTSHSLKISWPPVMHPLKIMMENKRSKWRKLLTGGVVDVLLNWPFSYFCNISNNMNDHIHLKVVLSANTTANNSFVGLTIHEWRVTNKCMSTSHEVNTTELKPNLVQLCMSCRSSAVDKDLWSMRSKS